MKFSYTQKYSKDKDTMLTMLCDPAYHKGLQDGLGSWDFKQIELDDNGTKFKIKYSYTLKSDVPLPGFAKKVLGENTDATQTETWDRSTGRGTVDVQPKGLPGTVHCDLTIEADGDGCKKVFNWDVKIKIPLVGGKLEKLIAEDITAKDPKDAAISAKLLKGY